MLVGYQGEAGAFSEQAVLDLIPDARTRGFPSFDELVEAVSAGVVERGLLPIENSIYGAIARSYDLLWLHPELAVAGETRAHIVQALIGVPGATLEGLAEVRSHPVALDQCRRFLAGHPAWKRRSVEDTAGAVREIMERGDPAIAAIGSARAAATYGARVIVSAIQDDPQNFTRFFLIARGPSGAPSRSGRACLAITLPHRVGSLRDALDVFARTRINLRSLVSRPSGEGPFLYRFYCELEQCDEDVMRAALASLEGEVRVLGIY
jgi:prephenate dehydratase